MRFVLFIGWALLIFICSDLVGGALGFRLAWPYSGKAWAAGDRPNTAGQGGLVDFAHSTLFGFAALWASLSAAYALGIATRGLMAGLVGFSLVTAAVAQHRNILSWARSRLTLWGLVGAIALFASFVTPVFNQFDDPEYFFLVNKLLRTGAIVEYFNYRRPITLGGWTFIQAIFSAGPAGVAYVASIDAIVGGVLFLFCAILLGAGAMAALPAAFVGVLAVQVFQVNLGTAIAMAALCAVLVSLSLPRSAPRHSFTPIAVAIMALTIRPQLGLIAIIGIAVVLWRNRSTSLLIPAAILAGISALWLAIFLRDTSLLPLSTSPGYNPQVLDSVDAPVAQQTSLLSQIALFWQSQWAAGGLILLALIICGWQSVTVKHGAAIRSEFRVLGAFGVATVATVAVMLAVLGTMSPNHQRYYLPVVDGFLYAFWIRVAVDLIQRAGGRYAKHASLLLGVSAAALCAAISASAKTLSVPAESSGTICRQLLRPQERRAFQALPSGRGITLLAINCPIGSFDVSSRIMIDDLFFATRGVYFDIARDAGQTANWLLKEGVDRIVYLDEDSSASFGPRNWQAFLDGNKSDPSKAILVWLREASYALASLEKLRELAQSCESVRIPIRDPQGPLVVVDVRQCKHGDSRLPAGANSHR
jgi:hypothetical protein